MASVIYTAISLQNIRDTSDYETDATRELGHLRRLNLIVGANNSGKSRLLRALCKQRPLHYRHAKFTLDVLNAIKEFAEHAKGEFDRIGVELFGGGPAPEYFATFGDRAWLSADDDWQAQLVAGLTKFENITDYGSRRSRQQVAESHVAELHRRLKPKAAALRELVENSVASVPAQRTYIPVLRGLRTATSGDDHYRARTEVDYEISSEHIFTGLSLYREIKDLLLGPRADREKVRAYEKFLSAEIFDADVELVPRREADVIFVRIGAEPERPIFSLGDGVQSLIVMTFLAFVADSPGLFFIEEPETHLHPGMQRRLVEILLRHPQMARHQFFATTHSNHLLDLTADYSDVGVFLVRRLPVDGEFRTSVMSVRQPERAVLHELGVRSSSALLTNATIWVEGVSDRLYLGAYLERRLADLKSAHYREDIHYSFLEAGGGCVAHLNFGSTDASPAEGRINVAAVCGNSIVVLDGDTATKPRGGQLQRDLGGRLVVLKGKEIEHLLPLEVLQAYISHRKIDPGALRLQDYHESREPLGVVLDRILRTDVFSDQASVKNKLGLMNFSLSWMRQNADTWKLTPDAIRVCDEIIAFVASANA